MSDTDTIRKRLEEIRDEDDFPITEKGHILFTQAVGRMKAHAIVALELLDKSQPHNLNDSPICSHRLVPDPA